MIPLLISIDRLKEFSVINENVDSKLIEPTIINVQELYLYDVLGKDLYNEIITQVNASSVTSLNQTLLNDYVEPYLINKVISEAVIDLNFKIRNKGIQTNSSDNGQPVGLTELSQLQGKYNNLAEGYKTKIENFLCENGTDYPLYLPINKHSTIGGIYVGNKRVDYKHRRGIDTNFSEKNYYNR